MTAPLGTSEPPFVGAGRHAVVDGLLAAFDAVNRGDGPLWVALEATSGTGKTRLARELYARLAAERQHSGAYWPPSILPTTADDDVASRRKRVHPVVEHVPGTLPAFCWWGVAASVRNGEPSSALAADVAQLEAHAPYLDDTWRRLASWTERNAGWWRRPASEVSQEVLMEAAGRAVEAALGASVPGLGLAVSLVQALRDQRTAARERTARLEGAATLTADHTDLLDRTAATLIRLGRPGLPVVVLVEDAHLADPLLAELLGRLVESDAAVLILTTQWPGHAEANRHLSEAMAVRPDRVVVAAAGAERLPEPFPPDASLDPLPAEDRAQIVRHYYPRADPDTLERLVARWTNPLALELFCLLGRYRDRFPDGDLRLPQSEVDRLPRTVEDLYRDLWRELPADVRRALTLASLGIPATIDSATVDPATSSDLAWHQPLLVRTLARVRVAPADDVARTLDEAPTTRAWARLLDDALRRFHELDQLRIAHDDDEFLFDSDRDEFRAALAQEVARTLDAGEPGRPALDGPELAHAARLALALHAQGHGQDATAVLAAAHLLLALADQPRELAYRTAVAERARALALAEPDAMPGEQGSWASLTVRAEHARCLGEAGRHAEALTAFEALLGRTLDAPDPDPAVVRRLRQAIGAQLLEIGRVEEALPFVTEELRLAQEQASSDDDVVLAARNDLAAALRMAGRHAESLAEWQTLLEVMTRRFGHGHRVTVHVLRQTAITLELLGRTADAVALMDGVVERTVAEHGPEAPVTLDVRRTWGALLSAAGDHQRALTEHEQLVADLTRLLGPRHPETLFTRADVALALDRLGRTEDAAAEYESLLPAVVATFGTRHRHTLMLRRNLAQTLLTSGDGRARRLLEDLVPQTADLLGADHPEVLHLRGMHAQTLSHDGDVDGGLALAREVWARYADLAPDHPTRGSALTNLAWHLRRCGRYDEAVEVDRQDIAETEGRHGPVHPDVRRALWALAGDLRTAGRHGESADALAELLRRTLAGAGMGAGTDADPVLADVADEAAWELAVSLDLAGRRHEAADVLDELVTRVVARHGEEHEGLGRLRAAQAALRAAGDT